MPPSAQVAELYEELKSRISQFSMSAGPRRPALDQEFTHKQRFILQVRVPAADAAPSRPGAAQLALHSWCLGRSDCQGVGSTHCPG